MRVRKKRNKNKKREKKEFKPKEKIGAVIFPLFVCPLEIIVLGYLDNVYYPIILSCPPLQCNVLITSFVNSSLDWLYKLGSLCRPIFLLNNKTACY